MKYSDTGCVMQFVFNWFMYVHDKYSLNIFYVDYYLV